MWLDAQSRALHGAAFGAIPPAQRAALLDALTVTTPAASMAKPVAFMDTLRNLFVLGFYSLPEGKADMGFIGDQPTPGAYPGPTPEARSEEHTSELQSLMRNSYAVFCLKKNKQYSLEKHMQLTENIG